MLVRYRRFRQFLIFERRDWRDRLIFALSLGILLFAGVAARLLLDTTPPTSRSKARFWPA